MRKILCARRRRNLRGISCSRSGNVAIMAAVCLPLLVGSLALGVDWGYLGFQKRVAQNDTDLAAISAASSLGAARTAIERYLANNGLRFQLRIENELAGGSTLPGNGEGEMTYTLGNYRPSGSLLPAQRFVAGGSPVNAVRVRLSRRADLAFARLFTTPPIISTEAVAETNGVAAFSIGSRLASLHGGILNAVLGKLLGASLDLDVMDYRSLLNADVDVFSFLDTAATRLNLEADDYNEILQSKLSIGRFVELLADTKGLSAQTRALLERISDETGSGDGGKLTLASLFDLGDVASLGPGGPAALSAKAGVLDLLSAAGAVANGDHQIELAVNAGLPGIASLSVSLLVGEPAVKSAWFAIGDTGTLVHTAQTRLRIEASIGGSGTLSGNLIDLPIYVEIANASARISNILCTGSAPDDGEVDIEARPGVAEAWIGSLAGNDLGALDGTGPIDPARLVDLKLLGVHIDGSAHAAITNPEADNLSFSANDIRDGTTQTVSTRSYAASLVSSLIGNLKLGVQAGGLRIASPKLVEQALASTLASAATPLDTALYNVLTALGIRVGEADVRVTGLSCTKPVLVQ